MQPPGSYTVRAARHEDVPELERLFIRLDRQEGVEPSYLEDDLIAAWQRSDFEVAADTFVISSSEGEIAGYGHVESRAPIDLVAMGWVHPDHCGLGLGSYLVQALEDRARAKAGASVEPFERVVNPVTDWDSAAKEILTGAGYVPIRHFWSMDIDLNDELPSMVEIDGVTVRTFVPDEAVAVHGVLFEAFKDHWGANFSSFEDWSVEGLGRKNHDPTMWWVAETDDGLAGALVADVSGTTGWIIDLGVLRGWRGRGIARALLVRSLTDFKRRGFPRACLGVDSDSPTGATRLYESAGMKKYRQIDMYAKPL